MQQTLMMIKPDAVERNLAGTILAEAESAGLMVVQLRMVQLDPEVAREFFKVHADKPFIDDLVAFMSRSPVVVGVLEGEDAVERWRATMGATDPAKAESGTIRALHGRNIQENSVHGSDSAENADIERGFFGLGLKLR